MTIKMTIKGETFEFSATEPGAHGIALAFHWLSAVLHTLGGATPEEMTALAARVGADADKFAAARASLTALGTPHAGPLEPGA